MLGVAIGKFLPFHRGHLGLLELLAARVDELVVIVCGAGWHPVPVGTRAGWIEESAATLPARTRVVTVDGDTAGLADDDSEGWARLTIETLGRRPDIVCTGEDYGDPYARALGCEHVRIDRHAAPAISGTAIRARPLAHLDWLEPQVRAHYALRVCVTGAESTGKSTLAADLAGRLATVAVPEFGRHYTEALPDPPRYRWTTRDFEVIAEAQARIEDDAARWAGPVVVCDTSPLVTAVFHELYLGAPDADLAASAAARSYDLHVLCDPETPFVQDSTGLRHSGPARRGMHDRLAELLAEQPAPVVEVSGGRAERVRQAAEALEPLLVAGGTALPEVPPG